MSSKSIAEYKAVLSKYIPEDIVDSMLRYLLKNDIYFVITNKRTTKLGDYRWPQHNEMRHRISVNGDLNKYAFLLVLLHEIAHYENYVRYKNMVKPHGLEWQTVYSKLLMKYINVFPSDVAELIARYISTIPLKNSIERELMDCVVKYDDNTDYLNMPQVKDLSLNTVFQTDDGRTFKVLEKRRTRYKCILLSTGQMYLVPGHMRVKISD